MGRLSRNAVHFWRARWQRQTVTGDEGNSIYILEYIYYVKSERLRASVLHKLQKRTSH
jgi:hypothetical protein